MSKKDEKAMRKRLEEDRARSQEAYGGMIKEQAPERAKSYAQGQELRSSLLPQFSNLVQTGGFDPGTTSNLRGFWGGSLASGGYNSGDISNIRRRSNAAIPAVYSRLSEAARRGGRGLSTTTAAIMAKLGRQGAQEAATTTRDTETEIADRIRSGRMQGAQGLQGLEESLRLGKLAGIGGQQDIYSSDIQQRQGYDLNQLRALGQQGSEIQGTYSPDLALATRPGAFQNAMQIAGTAASFASPFMKFLNFGAPKMDASGKGVG